MQLISNINFAICVIFFVCYLYQMCYIAVPFIKKDKPLKEAKSNRFAVLISARNEKNVIKNLIDSIKNQTYPAELIDIYVVADNCTDNTADIARACGVNVYERFDKINVGKGHALNYVIREINRSRGNDYYDGYFVFDADNILDPHYIEEMNKTFSSGYEILTSYRNSKNYGDNWISAGYGLWFLREAKYLNYPRMLLDTSCAVSGTGFMFSKKIAQEYDGWKYYLLTEDIEFTIDHVIKGYKVGFCKNAVLYDEQPTTFGQSVSQRMRWAKGYLQVFRQYGTRLVRGIFSSRFTSCYDMAMTTMPAIFFSVIASVVNMVGLGMSVVMGASPSIIFESLFNGLSGMYMMLFTIGAITTVTEWKNIYTTSAKKILYTFTFPLFMMTYIPISVIAIFRKVEWKPIVHNASKTLADIKSSN